MPPLRHGLHGVFHQVDDDLEKFVFSSKNSAAVFQGFIEFDKNPVFLGAAFPPDVAHFHRAAHRLREVKDMAFPGKVRLQARKGLKASDGFGSEPRAMEELIESLSRCLEVACLEIGLGQLRAAHDDLQQIVEVVSDAGGQFAHGFDTFRAQEQLLGIFFFP